MSLLRSCCFCRWRGYKDFAPTEHSPFEKKSKFPTPFRPRLGATVYGDGSVLKLSGALLATAAVPSKRRELIERLFLLPDLARVNVPQRLGAITLRFLKGGFDPAELLDALATAMRRRVITEHSFPNQHLLSRHEFRNRFEVHRAGEKLTLWRINPSGSKRLALVHALLQNDKVRASVMDALLSLVGITTVISRRQREIEIASYRWFVCEGPSLQPNRLSKWALLEVIESALAEALPLGRRTKTNFKLTPALIWANLVLAPIADYVFPPLGWVSATVIATLGAGHLGPAGGTPKSLTDLYRLRCQCLCHGCRHLFSCAGLVLRRDDDSGHHLLLSTRIWTPEGIISGIRYRSGVDELTVSQENIHRRPPAICGCLMSEFWA
jgi:hypothetical protein